MGAAGKEFEANANAAEMLYSPGDLAKAKVKIVGDPAWISQGNLFVDLSNAKVLQQIQASGFEPDGTICFDMSDVMFEMVWQRPQDYDLGTGLADPFSKSKAQAVRKGIQSRVYLATTCVSEFRQGRFEQTLEGSLVMFPVPGKTNAANAKGKENESNAERNRNAAANEKAKGRSSGLTDKQAQQARADFAAKDPRRSDSSDGGKAAILGAQGAYKQAQFAENAGGAAFGNPSITRQGITAGSTGTSALTTAGSPQPASSGSNSGAVIPVAENVTSAPPKMPAAGPGQNTLTPEQRRQVARAGNEARAAFFAEREAKNEQRLAASGSPVSTSIPSNQKIAKDY